MAIAIKANPKAQEEEARAALGRSLLSPRPLGPPSTGSAGPGQDGMEVDGDNARDPGEDPEEDTPEKLRAERWQAVQQRESDLRKIQDAIKALETTSEVDEDLNRLLERSRLTAEAFLNQAREHYRELRPQEQQVDLAKKDLVQTNAKLDRTKADLAEVQAQVDKLQSRKELLLGQQQAQQAKKAKLEGPHHRAGDGDGR
jgi:hypothetical protein